MNLTLLNEGVEKGNPMLLQGIDTGAATMANSMEGLLKTKNRIAI